jgi:hypothetical protein
MIETRWTFSPALDDRCGFVLAMRARICSDEREPRDEWLIVARWGSSGEFLSIAKTLVPAPTDLPVPIGLAPRLTALAVRRNRASGGDMQRFGFTNVLPAGTAVAGQFLATHGEVRLHFADGGPSLCGEGHCASLGAWRVQATWAAWDDEFVQDKPG